MSTQSKRHLSSINENLRAQHNNLKATKDHLLEHINDLIKRQKSLSKLKAELIDEMIRSQEQIKLQQKTKAPLCAFLREQLSELDKKYIDGNLKLRNLQNQYQLCLKDYEKVVDTVTVLLENASGVEGEFNRLKQSDITMKAMIFDCERLKRVLEQEKRYFKQLCNSEAKSHVQRVKQLQSIRKNIREEEDTSSCSIRLSKLHLGLMKLGGFFQKKVSSYRQRFIRQEFKQIRVVKLGVKTFGNCILIAEARMKENQRRLFRQWHHNAFPKSVLRDITERALIMNNQSRNRLKVISIMQQKIHQNNSEMLNLFQKLKYLTAVANKHSRKDKHVGFSKWRQSCRGAKRISNTLQHTFLRIIPRQIEREYFKKWNNTTNTIRRIDTAGILLKQYQTTKDIARIFRKWRFQVLNHQERHVRQYMRRIQEQQKITKRLNYEKRKVKILTSFQFKLTKIKLRNYFTKYWCNVKQMRAKSANLVIQQQREKFSEVRRATLLEQDKFKQKDKNLLITIFRDFVYKRKIVPVYKIWRNESQHFQQQKKSILSLVIRKQAKNKIFVMNQFRKCVQYYQKKQMHQVLTDLNKKMEAINQKSTLFREQLKNCIQNLGVIASKKMEYVANYAFDYQQRMLFNTYVSIKIKTTYKTMLLARMFTIFNLSCQKQTFSTILQHIKDNRKQIDQTKKADKFIISKNQQKTVVIFKWLKRQAKAHNQGFKMMIHIQNVFIFYRLAYAFAAIKRVYTAEKYVAMHKLLEDQGNVLKVREENMINLQNVRGNCEENLQKFFGKFVTYENRKQQIKKREKTHSLLKVYLTKFRKNVQKSVIKQKTTQNIGSIFMNKNQFLFFRNLMVIRYEQLMQQVKEQLGKINKKRKTFEQNQGKIKTNMERRIQEQMKVYNECKEYYEYYNQRYQKIINFYAKKTVKTDQMYIKRQIFLEWKLEYVATKRLYIAIDKIYVRKFIKMPYNSIITELKGRINRQRSQVLFQDLLIRKESRLINAAIQLWKVNIRKKKLSQIKYQLNHLDQREFNIKSEIKERAELISLQVPRFNNKKITVKYFMMLKEIWQYKKQNQRKRQILKIKTKAGYLRDAMIHWKWLKYYKDTKRSYLKFTQERQHLRQIKQIFSIFKFNRQRHHYLFSKMKAANNNNMFKVLHFSFDKIRNQAANQRDQLNYERRRALTTLISKKLSKIEIIKRKIMAKWNALLIPRLHYLPSIIKRLQLTILKSAFANINQKKYWNQIYIKHIADEVTTEGYNDINSVTNSLMREGFDPDQIKDYLKMRNDKDMEVMDRVIKHFKAWTKKEAVVRSFHSWKEYVNLKKNIKRSLTKVFNIAGGIGRYWGRWRTKDVHFNQILKKQSRGNMLNRYKELSRLLKEYHRDIRDNSGNLQELMDINRQYKEKNRMGVLMSLNSFSNSVKKGMRQGLYLWRDHIRSQRRVQMDERYEQMIQGLEMLGDQRSKVRYRIAVLRQENSQLKEKCMWGVQCGKILQKLLTEKDSLSIDLADKQHNLKMLLEDNLRLKQKVKMAKSHAQKLIRKVEEEDEEKEE